MMPMSALADGNAAVQATGNVAEVTIGNKTTQYADIDAAFAAAQEADSATVKLLADVTISYDDYSGIALKKGNITLDLNGKTLSKSKRDDNWFYAKNAVFWLSPPGATTNDEFSAALKTPVRLTVQDNSAARNGKIVQPNGGPAITAGFNTILTVNGGTIENTSSVDHDNESNKHMAPNCAVLLSGGGKAVINGGTLRGMRGVAVTGYITKDAEAVYKEHYGIDGYNNETYGNELTVIGGEISGTSGYALIVYEKAKKIELSGGTFTTQSNDCSIWAADTEPEGEPMIKGDAASLLKNGYRYEYSGTECAYSEDGKGVMGNATVALRPANEYAYIDKAGKLTTQTNCTEITEHTDDISTPGWYVVKENLTISSLNISGEVDLILCDEATLTVSNYMNVTKGSTLNLFWQSAGSGKLTAAAASSVLGTVTAPAGEMKQTTGAGGTTFEKCFEHDWEYTNNGNTHTAMCKLCGKAEAAESHKYDSWAPTNENTHTGTCACGATKTEDHTLTCTPNVDGLTHSTKCSVCGYTAAAESHNFDQTDDYGKKCACGAYLAAEYSGRQYATLARAIEAAKNGGTVTLQAATVLENITIKDGTNVTIDLNGKIWTLDNMNGAVPVLTVTGGSVTVKNGTLMSGSTSYAATAVEVEGGKLTVGEDMTIQGGMDADRQFPAIDVKGGELTLSEGTELVCGMRVPAGKQLKDYLPAGTAFQQTAYDQEDPTETAEIINGYVQECVGEFTLTVVTHTTHNMTGGACACGLTCAHETVENGVCTVCKQQMKAKTIASNGAEKYYLDLQDAFAGVTDGGTVTMLKSLTDDDTISFCNDTDGNPVEKTVTLMMNGKSLSYNGNTPLNIKSGKLIIADEATISQPAQAAVPAVFVDNDEQSKDRGTLEFQGKATLTGGLLIQNWGKLVGGLKEGSILTKNSEYSVSVEKSLTYSNVLDLLGDGLAFAKYDTSKENNAGSLVKGNVKQLTEDVIVVKHKHRPKFTEINDPNDPEHTYRYICECGFVCPHNSFTHSICNTCHAACTHDDCDTAGRCLLCDAQSAVLVEYTDDNGLTSTKWYMKTTTEDGTDDTLQQVFNEVKDGSTVTLLEDGLRASGAVTGKKNITLKLNDKRLVETATGITVDPDSTLKVTGEGSSTRPNGSKETDNYFVFNVRGGTLKFDDNFGGTFNGIRVGSGTLTSPREKQDAIHISILQIDDNKAKISFKAAAFDKIVFGGTSGSVKLGDLLGIWEDAEGNQVRSGNAFQNADGTFLRYDTAITKDNPVKNIKIAGCSHDSVTNRTCDYCGTENLVAARINPNGSMGNYAAKSGNPEDIKQAIIYALDGWGRSHGGTLKLYGDISLDGIKFEGSDETGVVTVTYPNATHIDLNGNKITGGTLTLDKDNSRGVNVTITDSSAGKTGSFSNVTVNGGAGLVVDGVSVGKITAAAMTAQITLKAGSKFTGYAKPDGMMLAQWIEDGDCISGSVDLTDTANSSGSGSFAVTKAPATIAANHKEELISYGARVPESCLPNIQSTGGTAPDKYHIFWYRRTESPSSNGLGDGRLTKDGSFGYSGSDAQYGSGDSAVKVGDTLDVFCVIKAQDSGNKTLWETVVKGYKLTVTKGKSQVTKPAEAAKNLTYTGAAQKLLGEGIGEGGIANDDYRNTMQYSLDGTNWQDKTIPTGTDAGEYTVWYRAAGDANRDPSEPQSIKVTIAPKSVDNPTIEVASGSVYNGKGQMPTVTVKDGDTTIDPKEYTASYSDNINAGENTATATITDKDGGNYTVNGSAKFTISKASVPTLTPVDITQKHSVTGARTASAAEAGMPQDAGTITYAKGTDSEIDKVESWAVDGTSGTVTYTLSGGSVGDKITLPVRISSTNYKDATASIVITLTDKDVPTVTAENLTVTYDGNPVSADKITGAATFNGNPVEGEWSWKADQSITNAADSGEKTAIFTPTDTANYAAVEKNIHLTINKATPTGAPKYTAITKEGQTLADANLTAEGENNESLFKALGKAIQGIVKWVESEDKTTELNPGTKVEQGKVYTWLFTPTEAANYSTLNGTTTLWAKPSSGGGGGGAVAPLPATPDTDVITEKDSQTGGSEGSDTTTKTTVKESRTETAKNEQGQTVSKTTASVSKETAAELVRQATEHKSDTVEITVKSGTTAAEANGVKSTELAIPKTAVEEIAKNTDADLVIKTGSGEVRLDNKTLETIVKEAKGDTVRIVVNENSRLTEAQKPAEKIIGEKGKLFDLAAGIGEKLIHHFGGGKAHVTLPMPEGLKGKAVLVIYINDKGFCEILNHTVEKVGADSYIKFTTSHFSTFAVVDKEEAEALIKAQNNAHVKELMQNGKFKVTTVKTSKKSVKVTVTAKNNKTLISDIKTMGYTVKYQFYRSTKKTFGYKLLKTKTTSSFTNTKGTKGTKYYYKARVLVYDGKTLIAKSELKQASCGVRTWTK